MSDRSNLIYLYDDTFFGLMCCIFESYTQKEIPNDILPINSPQISLFKTKLIETNEENAERVHSSIKKMGNNIEELVKAAFLYGFEEKAYIIFKFVALCYKKGAGVYNMLQSETVADIHDIVKTVTNEGHLLKEFLRFAEVDGGLVAFLDPKHYVLPLMQEHFCSRFNSERFLIFDKTHKMALLYQPFEAKLIHMEDIQLPDFSADEKQFQTLWAGYFKAIAIKERANARCQMGHMAKRFWKNMIETQLSTEAILKGKENMGALPPAKLPHLEYAGSQDKYLTM